MTSENLRQSNKPYLVAPLQHQNLPSPSVGCKTTIIRPFGQFRPKFRHPICDYFSQTTADTLPSIVPIIWRRTLLKDNQKTRPHDTSKIGFETKIFNIVVV